MDRGAARVSILHALEDLPPEAAARFGSDAAASPFHGALWFAVLAEACATPRHRPFLIASQDGGLIAPFAERRDRVGLHLESWTNFYSCDFTPCAGHLSIGAQAARLAAALRAARPRVDTLHLQTMRVEDGTAQELAAALRRHGWWTQIYTQFGNWYERVSGIDYEAYLARRAGRLRATIDRRTRRFLAQGGATLALATTPAELEPAIAAYEDVHRRSWKDAEPFPRFIGTFVRRMAAQGCIRIGVAALDGRPVAAQIWLVWKRRATIAKLAHDEALRDLSPGTVLTAWMIRAALEANDVDEIDFGRGDDAYKRDWLACRRPVGALMAGNLATLRGASAALRHLAPPLIRRGARLLARGQPG
jgi:CelD/BcsL family acetyltransferase involved in cellulose biosynthesis